MVSNRRLQLIFPGEYFPVNVSRHRDSQKTEDGEERKGLTVEGRELQDAYSRISLFCLRCGALLRGCGHDLFDFVGIAG